MGWARAKLTSTNGENPKKRPPTKLAPSEDTHRRSNQNMARAESAGDSRSIRLSDATGPHSQVTGTEAIPNPSELGAMSIPRGTNSLEEKKGLSPWLTA